jgi:hypothetical protein
MIIPEFAIMMHFKSIPFVCLLLAAALSFPGALRAQQDGWIPFRPSDRPAPGSLDLSGWLDAPAGHHGFVQIKGKDLVFEDGGQVKFWGTNIAGNRPFMPPQETDEWVEFLARYGFNAIRFHKFTWEAGDGVHSTAIRPELWQNFDYLCHALREKGIYYGWSHIYGHKLRPGDSARVLAYRELADTEFPWSHLNGTSASLVNFAEDLQALNIELTVNMLEHVNPRTGLRYADDPALAFVELQNEDNIFWSAIERTLEQTPTYRQLLCDKFSAWLLRKYGDLQSLEEAWAGEGLAPGESLGTGIYPNPNHSLFSHECEQAAAEGRPIKPHIVDRLDFLLEEQNKFYDKFVEAIRATGYKGPIVASCWQAGTGLSHVYNLYADYRAGIIDRHNYHGGGRGHRLAAGPFDNSAMVSAIGSGLYGSGLQQVSDRPFFLSEWMSLIPSEWTAESAPLIAVYGMGLQGWDGSFSFATDHPRFTPTLETPPWGGIYNTTSPLQLALYPALAMMVYRGDVREGEIVVNRNLHLPGLAAGKRHFVEKVEQDHDRKSFSGSFPLQAMAAGRVCVSFTEKEMADVRQEIAAFQQDGGIRSSTGQLFWSEAEGGYFTLDTEGTAGMVGFIRDKVLDTKQFQMSSPNEFAVVLLSSMERDRGLADAGRVLVTTMARARNSGMQYDPEKKTLIETGTAPIVLEPVTVDLRMKRKGRCRIYPLDHNGARTGVVLSGKKIRLDGRESGAIYYEIVFEP